LRLISQTFEQHKRYPIFGLSSLLLIQGTNFEAKNILSETVEWFTEGHDNKELAEAKILPLEL